MCFAVLVVPVRENREIVSKSPVQQLQYTLGTATFTITAIHRDPWTLRHEYEYGYLETSMSTGTNVITVTGV